MQECSKCKENKTIHEFSFRNKNLNKRQRICKICARSQVQRHYLRNREYYLDKTRRQNEKVRRIARDYVWKYLQTRSCVDCGERDTIVLEFDHKSDKKIDISRAIRDGYSVEKIKVEIKKCEVRCANCHRRKTARDLGWFKSKMPL